MSGKWYSLYSKPKEVLWNTSQCSNPWLQQFPVTRRGAGRTEGLTAESLSSVNSQLALSCTTLCPFCLPFSLAVNFSHIFAPLSLWACEPMNFFFYFFENPKFMDKCLAHKTFLVQKCKQWCKESAPGGRLQAVSQEGSWGCWAVGGFGQPSALVAQEPGLVNTQWAWLHFSEAESH